MFVFAAIVKMTRHGHDNEKLVDPQYWWGSSRLWFLKPAHLDMTPEHS